MTSYIKLIIITISTCQVSLDIDLYCSLLPENLYLRLQLGINYLKDVKERPPTKIQVETSRATCSFLVFLSRPFSWELSLFIFSNPAWQLPLPLAWQNQFVHEEHFYKTLKKFILSCNILFVTNVTVPSIPKLVEDPSYKHPRKLLV